MIAIKQNKTYQILNSVQPYSIGQLAAKDIEGPQGIQTQHSEGCLKLHYKIIFDNVS